MGMYEIGGKDKENDHLSRQKYATKGASRQSNNKLLPNTNVLFKKVFLFNNIKVRRQQFGVRSGIKKYPRDYKIFASRCDDIAIKKSSYGSRGTADGSTRNLCPQRGAVRGSLIPSAPPSATNFSAGYVRETPLLTSYSSRITHRSHASKSTVLAQQLSLKAQHARRIAELEAAREQAELTRRAADRELNIAELELQADLAAAEAASSLHSSRSTRAKVES
ncbi:hypothetical protein ACJJTC_015161 [Scirpophaga incertulas]